MNNYYEILEVSKNASKEVIEKAYKVLAKKYHPDLQDDSQKQNAEQMMKKINEAYEVLSDDEKRKEYDEKLEYENKKQEEYNNAQNESNNRNYYSQNQNQNQNQSQNQYYNQGSSQNHNNNQPQYEGNYKYNQQQQEYEKMKIQQEYENRMKQAYIEEQERRYRNYLRSLGYRIKEKWTWKKTLKLLIIIAVIILVFTIAWYIPPTHDWMVNIYESNPIIRTIIDTLGGIVTGFFNGIGMFFSNLFNWN